MHALKENALLKKNAKFFHSPQRKKEFELSAQVAKQYFFFGQ